MATQLWLPTLEPRPLKVLLFVLKPSPTEAGEIASIARSAAAEFGLTQRLFPSDRYHISLFCGGASDCSRPELIARLMDTAADVALGPVDLLLDRLDSFAGEQREGAWVLRSTVRSNAVEDLAQRLGEAAAFRRVTRRRRFPITPHLTVAYGCPRLPARSIDPLVLRIRELFLIESHQGFGRHTIVDRWALRV